MGEHVYAAMHVVLVMFLLWCFGDLSFAKAAVTTVSYLVGLVFAALLVDFVTRRWGGAQ